MSTRNVLITAGANGIGLALARAFHADGARVYICDLDEPALARAASALPGLLTRACDVGDRAAVAAMVADAAARLGGIDVLINNAGIGGPTKPLQDLDPADWDAVVRVNLTGTFDVTRCAIPHLRRSAHGVVLLMSSAAGRFGYPNRSAYSATKWALVGLAKTLAIELGEYGIRVNAIAPGEIDTPMNTDFYAEHPEFVEQMEEFTPAGRLGKASDIAPAAVFLASDMARFVYGVSLPVDGGIVAR
jgi:NAD(P)-dependent dehydrogenase (short-subunit alcohol dehydrogenase family)